MMRSTILHGVAVYMPKTMPTVQLMLGRHIFVRRDGPSHGIHECPAGTEEFQALPINNRSIASYARYL